MYFSPDPDPGGGGDPDPKKKPEVTVEQAIEKLKDDDKYVLMTTAEFATKEKKIRKDEAINKIGVTHGMYDTFFNEISGLERDADANEKTIDFGKRAMEKIQKEAEGAPNERIEALKGQVEDTKQKYLDLQSSVSGLKEGYEKKLLNMDIETQYQTGIIGVLPKLGYEDDNEKRLALAGFKSEFFSAYRMEVDEEGDRQVVDKKTGKPVQNDALENKSPQEVVQEFALSMLKLSNGASTGGAGTKKPGSKKMPAITSIEDLDAHLTEKYGGVGSKEWVEERTKLRAELAV
jgi:hypothetical protein